MNTFHTTFEISITNHTCSKRVIYTLIIWSQRAHDVMSYLCHHYVIRTLLRRRFDVIIMLLSRHVFNGIWKGEPITYGEWYWDTRHADYTAINNNFCSKVNFLNVNCAQTTAFIFDTRTDVLVKVSKFLRQKMSRPEEDSNPQPSDSCRML